MHKFRGDLIFKKKKWFYFENLKNSFIFFISYFIFFRNLFKFGLILFGILFFFLKKKGGKGRNSQFGLVRGLPTSGGGLLRWTLHQAHHLGPIYKSGDPYFCLHAKYPQTFKTALSLSKPFVFLAFFISNPLTQGKMAQNQDFLTCFCRFSSILMKELSRFDAVLMVF